MTTECISGECPCCGFDRMLMRFGSTGWAQWECCARCGFGYYEGDTATLHHHDAFEHLSDVFAMYAGAPGEVSREELYRWVMTQQRDDTVAGPLFIYSPEELDAYRQQDEPIYN